MTRRAQPRALGDALRTVRTEAEPATPLAAVQSVWSDALGERIAAEAQPVSERAGVVTVGCSAATWAQELDLLQDDLLSRLNGALGGAPVRRLRFVVGADPASD